MSSGLVVGSAAHPKVEILGIGCSEFTNNVGCGSNPVLEVGGHHGAESCWRSFGVASSLELEVKLRVILSVRVRALRTVVLEHEPFQMRASALEDRIKVFSS